MPIYLTRRRVLNAYRALRDFTSEDRFFGLLAQSAVLNYAQKHEDGTNPIDPVFGGVCVSFARARYNAGRYEGVSHFNRSLS